MALTSPAFLDTDLVQGISAVSACLRGPQKHMNGFICLSVILYWLVYLCCQK